jgi:hypothetical protein
MRKLTITICLFMCCITGACAQEAWHNGLYLGNGGYWHQRIRLTLSNAADHPSQGDPVAVRIGKGAGEVDLVGAMAESIRVCDAKGTEMLWGITAPDGQAVKKGPVLEGGQLIVPAECDPKASAVYFAYFDNPQAWGVPDFFEGGVGLRNGSLEEGEGDVPTGWAHDSPDDQHHASWVTENPHSGKHCLKTVVAAGAEPTWIATRQSNITLIGGAKYVMRGWVKAQDVVGQAGWYIHVGNDANPMIVSPMLNAGEGTFDWKEVQAEFVAPKEANKADLGTVLRGTGTAWFDDVSLECDAKPSITMTASAPERLQVTEVGDDERWPALKTSGGQGYPYRFPIRVMNLSDQPLDAGLISVDVSGPLARVAGRADASDLRVTAGGKQVDSFRLADTLVFECGRIPARTIQTCYVYLPGLKPGAVAQAGAQRMETRSTGTSEDTRQAAAAAAARLAIDTKSYAALLNSPRNLVKNPSFEHGDALPTDWPGGAEGEKPAGATLGFDQPGLFGARCAKLAVPADVTPSWTGWRQIIPVQAGKTYLYAGWVKCKDCKDNVQLYAHIRNAKDEVLQFTGAGPAISGTTDWTLLAGMFEIPEGATNLQVHLTMNTTGTVWHDGIVVAEVSPGAASQLQTKATTAVAGLTAWPVNAIVKVFREDVPPATAPSARLTTACNEREPLQIAVRSPQAVKDIRISVDPPTNAAGAKLGDVSVGVLGYVPIDHKTNYYSIKSPAWHRKFPTTEGSSDGWAGWWPDPILPHDTFDLAANSTQAIWVDLAAPKGAAPGDYKGKVRLTAGGRTLREVPFALHVWDFTLPDELHTAAIYDSGLGDRWQIPGQTAEQTRWQYWKFMADHRVCPDRVAPDPVIKYENGKVIADFTEFDKAAHYYLDELHLPHTYTPAVFYMFGWGFPPDTKFGEKPYEGEYPFKGVDRGKLRPEFKRAVQACLRAYWDHMKAKGWDKKVTYYMSDEPFASQPETIAQMKALCDMVKEVDPTIPIYSSTWSHIPQWDGYISQWGIGHYGIVPEEKIRQIRASGVRVWYTTDGQMCTDTPYCAIERLLPHYCFKYNVAAYEFWGSAWLTYNPYEFGWHSYIFQSDTPTNSYYVRYPNGDGFIAYPGAPIGNKGPVPSMRMEQAREGVEDYEYLYMLRERIAAAKAAGKDARAGEKAMQAADALVDMPSAGGRYSTKILPDPDVVFRVKEQVAKAIEALPGK